MKRLFYRFIRILVRLATPVMFSRVELRGMERIPTDRPCVVSPNHVNAFLDALLIGAYAPTDMRYLSRSSAFGTRWDWFLEALQMVPIYRRRDGYGTLSRNWEIFQQEQEKLGEGNALLIFSEAEHAHTYHLRPLSRGSSRFALQTQAAIDEDVVLLPVGINYYHLTRPGFKVSVVIGEPIEVRDFEDWYETDEATGINDLRDVLTARMKDCLLLPTPTDDFAERIDYINRRNEALPFPQMKAALAADAPSLEPKGPHRPGLERLARGVDVLNALPAAVAQTMMDWVQDEAFAASLKFAIGLFVLPVWWALLFGLGWALHSPVAGMGLAALAMTTLLLRQRLIRHANPPHPDSVKTSVEAPEPVAATAG